MQRAVYFSIFSLATRALDRTMRCFISIIKIYWLPWLVAVACFIVLFLIWHTNTSAFTARNVLILNNLGYDLIWAPFFALIAIAILRADCRPGRTAPFLKPIFTRHSLMVGGILGALYIAYAAIDMTYAAIKLQMALSLLAQRPDSLQAPIIPQWHFAFYVTGAWPPYVLVNLIGFAVLAVGVFQKRFSPREALRLIAMSPLHIIGYVLVISAACVGFNMIYGYIYYVINVPDPITGIYFHWHEKVLANGAYYLVDAPRLFLVGAFQLFALRELYHVLARTNNELDRRADLIRQKKR